MVYNDAMRRRATKDKWERRRKDAEAKVKEIQALNNEYASRAWYDSELKSKTQQILDCLVEDYDHVAYCYRWLGKHLSGG